MVSSGSKLDLKSSMPAASSPPVSRQPAFTLDQTATITRWSCSRPLGLRIRIVTHHQDFLEVAEVFLRHPATVLYLMNPTDCGTVFLVRPLGGTWELDTLEAALLKVLALKVLRLNI